MKTGLTLVSLAMLLSANSAISEEINPEAKWGTVTPYITAAYAFGGDDVGRLEYEEGGSQDVTAGGGYTLGGGLHFQFSKQPFGKPLGLYVSANYHADSAVADNADVTFDRFEINVLPYVKVNETTHIGLGFGFHNAVELEVDFQGKETVEFDGATALIAELGFESSEQLHWGFRATSVDYELNDSQYVPETKSGNNIGIFINYSFKK